MDFHEHQGAPQTVDDAYCAFVWSVVAQHPEVRVGTVPEGSVEVPIAPRQRQKEKGAEQEKGSKKSKGPSKAKEDDAAVVQLQLIPDAALRSLDELKEEYGDALRIAVSPERSLVAITGSHFRVYAVSPQSLAEADEFFSPPNSRRPCTQACNSSRVVDTMV